MQSRRNVLNARRHQRKNHRKLAAEANVPFLGDIPIDPRVAECGDLGDPIVHKYPDSPAALGYVKLAQVVADQIGKAGPPAELPGLQL